MIRTNSIQALFVAVLALFTLSLASCNNDDDGPTVAEILIVDTAGVTQPNVDVRVFCSLQPTCIIDDRKKTNSRGISTHEFDLPAVLQIHAVRLDSTVEIINPGPFQEIITTYDSVCGDGFVTLEENGTVRETITLFECIE